jgi:ABC-type phosphate transport system substrate-binding protein
VKSLICALVLATTSGGAQLASARQPDADFVVVVSASNPVTSVTRDQASKLFLKKVPSWDNGRGDVVPVDQPEGSPVREAFTKAVLHKSVAAVKSYWQQQIFSGRGVPPTERPSDGEVLNFVRTNANAIGYVSASAPVGSGVKVVNVVD